MNTEPALLVADGRMIVADVPEGCRLYDAPPTAPAGFAGAAFERAARDCEVLRLPLFRRVARRP